MMDNTEFQTGRLRPVECFTEGWQSIKDDYWLLFAISLVGGIIGGVTMYILFGAMACGMFYANLRKFDGGRHASFDDLWKGFQWWAPGSIVTAFIVVSIIVVYVILYVPFFAAIILGSNLNESELFGLLFGAFVFDLVALTLMVCFHSLLIFSFPLIVDRNLGGFKAMATSARAVWNNLGGVAGLLLINFVIVLLGMMAFCVGIYFVIPIMIAGNVAAYRKVFPALGPQRSSY